jgi:hypothetical protein
LEFVRFVFFLGFIIGPEGSLFVSGGHPLVCDVFFINYLSCGIFRVGLFLRIKNIFEKN